MCFRWMLTLALSAAAVPLGLGQNIETPKDFTEFSKLVHQLVVKQLPKEFEDKSGWGGAIPDEPNLRLPNLRTRIRVGDQVLLPHGTWRKFKLFLEDPNRDLAIAVKDFRMGDNKKYQLKVDTLATVKVDGEVQQWQKGISLIGASAQGDALIEIKLIIDIGVSFNLKTFPPQLDVDPKVADCKVELKDFSPLRNKNGNPQPGDLGERIKGFINQGLRSQENAIKDLANKAIADSLKDNKGALSAGEMLKVLTPTAN